MKILLPLLLLATLGMLAALPHIANADDNGQNEDAHHQTGQETNHEGLSIRFHIHLTGDQQVPAVVVLPFFGSPSPFNSTRGCDILAEGTRTSDNLVARPDAGINTWTDFINALIAGNTYVNVHTTAHTGGEIRGQLVHEQDDENDQAEQGDD